MQNLKIPQSNFISFGTEPVKPLPLFFMLILSAQIILLLFPEWAEEGRKGGREEGKEEGRKETFCRQMV
ncbi:hypothetical protein FK518_30415 [Klebsiella pneumoniae]|nr:hypothetical protein [Klebsiella pneumoniae]